MSIFRQEMLARSQVLAVPAEGNVSWRFGAVLSPVAVIMPCPSVAPQLLLWAPLEAGGRWMESEGKQAATVSTICSSFGGCRFCPELSREILAMFGLAGAQGYF